MLKKLLQSLLVFTITISSITSVVSLTGNKEVQLSKKDKRINLKKYFHNSGSADDPVNLFNLDYGMFEGANTQNCQEKVAPTFRKILFHHYPALKGIDINIMIFQESSIIVRLDADGAANPSFKGHIYGRFPRAKNVAQNLSLSFVNNLGLFSLWSNAIWSQKEKITYCYDQMEKFAQANGYEYYYHRDLNNIRVTLNNQLLKFENSNEAFPILNWESNYLVDTYQGSIEVPFERLKQLKLETKVVDEHAIKSALAEYGKIDENEFELVNLKIEEQKFSGKIIPNRKLRESLQKFNLQSEKKLVEIELI